MRVGIRHERDRSIPAYELENTGGINVNAKTVGRWKKVIAAHANAQKAILDYAMVQQEMKESLKASRKIKAEEQPVRIKRKYVRKNKDAVEAQPRVKRSYVWKKDRPKAVEEQPIVKKTKRHYVRKNKEPLKEDNSSEAQPRVKRSYVWKKDRVKTVVEAQPVLKTDETDKEEPEEDQDKKPDKSSSYGNYPDMSIYMDSIKNIPKVEAIDEKHASKDDLVKSNLKFVVKIAHKYKSMLPLEDLIQEGNLGLIDAANRFNPRRNIKFITYAVHYIKKYMRMAINRNYGVKGGKGKSTIFSLQDTINEDYPKATIENVFSANNGHISPDIALSIKQRNTHVESMINQYLNGIEAQVLRHRFGFDDDTPKTLKHTGKILNYSIPGVRAIEIRAMDKLRKVLVHNNI